MNKSHIVGQLLNSIHDARTNIYKIQWKKIFVSKRKDQEINIQEFRSFSSTLTVRETNLEVNYLEGYKKIRNLSSRK